MKLFLLSLLSVAVMLAQTAVVGSTQVAYRCPSAIVGQVLVPIALPIPATPSISTIFFTCAVLDPKAFTIDQTTTPWTVRAVPPVTVSPAPALEVPAGTMNGVNQNFTLSKTPAVGAPMLVMRNGLVLTGCATTTGCNGDYQTSGTTLLFLSASQTASGNSAIPEVGDLVQVLYFH